MDTDSNYTETLEKTIRDLLERQDDLIRTAFTDELTGLGNRGGFARSLEEIWEQELPVTMAFIDIDNLKHCNDIFGHDEGNRYILQVSLYLKLYMKVDEAAFRLGGDEFAILSTIATEDDLAERLEHCREVLLKNNDSEMPHSFSCGCSCPIAGTDAGRNLFVLLSALDAERNRRTMLMYGKEASNRKQEIDRQHYTIPNQRPKDKHFEKI